MVIKRNQNQLFSFKISTVKYTLTPLSDQIYIIPASKA